MRRGDDGTAPGRRAPAAGRPPHGGTAQRGPGPSTVRVAAFAVAVALVAAACGGASADRAASGPRPRAALPTTTGTTVPDTTVAPAPAAPARLEPGMPADWQPAPLDWAPCERSPRAQCATLAVPLDWAAPDGATVDLAVARRPATGGAERRIGPLLTNPGGPGASGVDFVLGGPVTADVARRFDLVGWDPRGVGASVRVRCREGVTDLLGADTAPDDEEEQAALDRAGAAVSADCARTDGALLPHVGTADAARDMEALRRALGDEQVSFLGFSYGTHLGQAYAARFPERVRAMALDGIVDPAQGFTEFLLGQVDGFEEAFARAERACAGAGRDRCGVDDLGAAYDDVARRVERRPLDTSAGPVGPAELAVAATFAGYLDGGWQQLGPALADALRGDGDALRALADNYYSLGSFTSYVAVVCVDSPPPDGPAAYRAVADAARERSPRFGGSIVNELLPCATWPAEAGAPAVGVVAEGTPTVLVVGSTGDPATPYRSAVAVSERLADAVLLTVERDGHTAYAAVSCVRRAVDRYLLDLVVPEPGTTC